jgi:hypothetical protein
MNAGAFALCVLAALALLAVPALVYARRQERLSAAVVALPFAPAVALYVALVTMNGPAQVGWGFVVYPFFCIVLSITLLYVQVIALRSLGNFRLLSGSC